MSKSHDIEEALAFYSNPANLPHATRCAECGVPANNGTPGHPPLCYECVEIWYPSELPDDDA